MGPQHYSSNDHLGVRACSNRGEDRGKHAQGAAEARRQPLEYLYHRKEHDAAAEVGQTVAAAAATAVSELSRGSSLLCWQGAAVGMLRH